MNDTLEGEARTAPPISTSICAACGELDGGIYLTENNPFAF